jgi:hypothetical protein
MTKLILAFAVISAGLCASAQAGPAAPRHERPVRLERVEYARLECILPWYRFFGACPEAIDAPTTGGNSPHSGWRHHHHH